MTLDKKKYPPLYIMKKLVSMYNHDLKIPRFSKLNREELHKWITSRNYKWVGATTTQGKIHNKWDLVPNAQMKRQKKYMYDIKTKVAKKGTTAPKVAVGAKSKKK